MRSLNEDWCGNVRTEKEIAGQRGTHGLVSRCLGCWALAPDSGSGLRDQRLVEERAINVNDDNLMAGVRMRTVTAVQT